MDGTSLKRKTEEAERIVCSFLPEEDPNTERIISAVRYSVTAGGKRLRPLIMAETFAMFCENPDDELSEMLHRFMAAIEYIHSYSLVHDDLPAMDNDMLRRGVPTTHAAFGEAFGVLAGDALLNLAFETVLEGMEKVDDARVLRRCVRALGVLAAKAGIRGMIGGQCLDVYAEKTEGVENDLERTVYIYENKTGALLEAAFMIGAILADASQDEIRTVEKTASEVGMAFQIRDDILDITSTTDVLGKPVGSDEKNHKMTYVSFKGLEESQRDVERHSEAALNSLASLPYDNGFLKELISYLISRDK